MVKEGNVTIELSKEKHPEFGMMGKLTFDNKSKIYIFEKGWHISHPDVDGGFTLTWAEINLAVDNSLKLGYVNSKQKGVKQDGIFR